MLLVYSDYPKLVPGEGQSLIVESLPEAGHEIKARYNAEIETRSIDKVVYQLSLILIVCT
jgi:hypothetical protein